MKSIAIKRSLFGFGHNVQYTHLDANGNVKKMFVENKLGSLILKKIREHISNPIDENGSVKPGVLNYLSAYGVRVPFVTGTWSTSRKIHNLVTTVGKAAMASRLNGSGGEAAFTYIAVGTGTTAAAVGDTTLQTETATSGLSRVAATVSRTTTDTTNDTAQLQTTFSVTGTVAVTESGVFNAASSGVLLARQVFSAVNVVNGDSLQITWAFDID